MQVLAGPRRLPCGASHSVSATLPRVDCESQSCKANRWLDRLDTGSSPSPCPCLSCQSCPSPFPSCRVGSWLASRIYWKSDVGIFWPGEASTLFAWSIGASNSFSLRTTMVQIKWVMHSDAACPKKIADKRSCEYTAHANMTNFLQLQSFCKKKVLPTTAWQAQSEMLCGRTFSRRRSCSSKGRRIDGYADLLSVSYEGGTNGSWWVNKESCL